jgi:hypothetical protein
VTDIIRIEPGRFTAGAGKFDSAYRYLRQALTGTGTPMVHGESCDASGTYLACYNVNGYTKQADGNANPFVASVTLVKKT